MIFGKKKTEQIEALVDGILNSERADILVVRGEECRVLYANDATKGRLRLSELDLSSCKRGYSRLFPGLCDRCPALAGETLEKPVTFDTLDADGRIFEATLNTVEWLDGKPATIYFLRDVNEDRGVGKKLYELAYLDHLTGIPNRQKFKEDFEKIAERVGNNEMTGVIAIFDLDNFKGVNDTYGHNTGDIMLQRLTEHLQSDPSFAGHIYRLGGDEFIFLFTDPVGRFSSEEEQKKHYGELLQGALLSYTMPYIDMACTLSMGVAFFPQHGATTSELLRKADIALYKAKAAGRNRLMFFEDQFDSVKKFKDLYINIQPVLTNAGKTFGYELIDRGNEGKEEEKAVNLSEFNRTMDAIGLDDMENDSKFFITYSKQLLGASVRNNLPKDKFIIQINVPDAVKPEELHTFHELKKFGYSLAMAGLHAGNMKTDILTLADYCKFAPGAMNEETRERIIAMYPDKVFIATEVNQPVDFQKAKQLGYRLFQGFYFNQPTVVKKTKEIDPMKVNYIRLLRLTSTPGYVDFREISAIIASDVALSYKLLRLLNSAAVGLRYRISSISMAVAYLGEESLKKWIALLALRGVAADKPMELLRMSLIRARFGELLAPEFRPRRDPKQVFLVGMFSLLHVALEKTREEVFDEMPVAEEIRESLLTKDGVYSDLISFYSNYEYANWDEISKFATEHNLTSQTINESYIAAVKWYNDLAATV